MSIERAVGRAALMIYIEPTPYVLALVRQIASKAHAQVDVLFIAANVSQAWDLSLEGVPAEYLPRDVLAAVRAIAAKLDSARYCVVHLAGWGHPALVAAMIVAHLRGIPVAMETDTVLPFGQPWAKRAAKRLVYPIMFRIPAVFLPGGTRQKRYLQHYGVPDGRVVVAQMTVDVTAIASAVQAISSEDRQAKRAAIGVAPDACVFLFVGRLDPVKGIAVLLEAFTQVSSRTRELRLLIAGDGAMRDVVQLATVKSDRIRWAGRLTGGALLDAYASADVLVLPSLSDSWGLVVNEAMAAAIPVIASDRVGCVDDLVSDGQTGIVVQAGNVSALAKAMARLADDAPLRRIMGAAARERICGWTIEAEAQIVTEAWRRVSRA